MPTRAEADEAIRRLSGAQDADLLVYWGDLLRPQDDRLVDLCRGRTLRRNCILWLTTRGGDPHAAYRIARCLQRVYKSVEKEPATKGMFTVFVNTICRSAGTILALGASKLILSDRAELGPIDIQLRKPDEVGERTSGLTPIQSLGSLETHSTRMFKKYFRQLRFDDDLSFSTKMAADIATNITIGLMNPLYSQIDPIRLAEVERLLKIAGEYGERIGKNNLKAATLEKLLSGYPSHSFVIDRMEARELFEVVEEPSADLEIIASYYDGFASLWVDRDDEAPLVAFMSQEPQPAAQVPQAPPATDGAPQVVIPEGGA